MKNILRLMTLCTVAVLALASCKKDNKPQANVPENGFLATVEANQGNGGRTHLVGTEVQWNAGDKIVVRNTNGDVATYRLTDGENTTEGTFYSSEDANDFFHPSYTAIYPATEGNSITGEGTVTFTLPATQSYVANSFANGAMPMMAVSDDQTLAFKNVLGGICFPMVGDNLTVTRLVLTSKSASDHLSGVFSANFNNGQPTLTYTSGGANSITLDCGVGVTLSSTATDFTIMLPAGSLANGFTVTAYNGETAYAKLSTTANPGIVRSTISKVNQSLEVEEVVVPEGAINGLFTINDNGDKVYFSKGNLQYQASTGTWRFAEHQWDYVGRAPGNTTANEEIRATQAEWIDFFCWGTSGWNSGANCYQPYTISQDGFDFQVGGDVYNNLNGDWANADWGVYNAISNGGNQAGQWRTLLNHTSNSAPEREWGYILFARNTASGIRYAKAQVASVDGLILLPDDWSVDVYSLSNTNVEDASYSSNVISATQWATLENAGAVFLPAAGNRWGTSVWNLSGGTGSYWSSKNAGSSFALGFSFNSSTVYNAIGVTRAYGFSVRLVHDAN